MTTVSVILLTIILLLVLLVVRAPIALALGISGAVGLVLLEGTAYATASIVGPTFSNAYSFSLVIVPMFILMGLFAVRANIAEYVFDIAAHLTKRLPGGLGVATVVASAGFAAVSGSSIGTVATMSKLSVSEMRKHGYPASLATSLVAVSGTLGVLIPPSTFLVLYAVMAQVSVAQILVAGILPGLLSAVALIIYIMTFGARKIRESGRLDSDAIAENNDTEAVVRATIKSQQSRSLKELFWRGLFYIVLLFGIIIGGMYSGLFTATEAAAFGALAAVVILIWEQRRSGLRGIVTHIRDALLDTSATTSMVFFILFGSVILSQFFVAARVPTLVRDILIDLGLSPGVMMAILLAFLIPLGMFLESLSLLLLSVPILVPLASEFAVEMMPPGHEGLVLVWLGIVLVKLIEIGLITPPVGMNIFVVAGVTRTPSETVFRGVLPLFIVDLVVTVILFLFPWVSILLPSLIQTTI